MNSHWLSEQGWQIAGWTMVYFLVVGTVVALVAAVVRFAIRGAAPSFRYATSLAVFAVLALLPAGIALYLAPSSPAELPLATSSPERLAVSRPAMATTVDLAEGSLSVSGVVADAPPIAAPIAVQSPQSFAGVVDLLPWLWLVGTPLTFLLLATGLIGAERLRHSSRLLSEGSVFEAAEQLRKAAGLGRNVAVGICDRVATPLLVGIVRPLILLPPAALIGWSPEDLEMVLMHELAHVRRWDNLVNLAQRIVESVLFFHPAVWLVSHWVRLDREDCCDAVVVARTAKPQAYAELLVSFASSSQPLAGLAMARHPLGGRIRRILRLPEEPMRVSRGTLIAIGVAIALLVIAPASQGVPEAGAEDVATEGTENTEQDDPLVGEVVKTEIEGVVTSSQFPTLEEQRMADVAYKLLGVELEKLSDEELGLVQSKNYKGGLRVDSYGDFPAQGLTKGDLLVGLHVWPTESLDQVSAILNRDDLDQLSPLKFYAVQTSESNGRRRSDPEIITGRISVHLDEWRSLRSQSVVQGVFRSPAGPLTLQLDPAGGMSGGGTLTVRDGNLLEGQPAIVQQIAEKHKALAEALVAEAQVKAKLATQDLGQANKQAAEQLAAAQAQVDQARAELEILKSQLHAKLEINPDLLQPGDRVFLRVKGALPDEPLWDVYEIESMGTISFGPTYGRLKIAGKGLVEAEDMIKEHLRGFVENPLVQLTLQQKAGRTYPDAKPVATTVSRELLPASNVPPTPVSAGNEPQVLYDGKTFELWRQSWKTELSIDRRLETVRAMAAFGNAGYGKEAAKVILEIAGEYDWNAMGLNNAIEPLQKACLSAFGSSVYSEVPHAIPEEDATTVLLEAVNSKNVRIKALLNWILPELSVKKDARLRAIEQLKQDKDLQRYQEPKERKKPGAAGGFGGGGRF